MSLISILPMLSLVLLLKSYTNMKKILIPILFFLFTIPAIPQTGTGWVPQRVKANFRDSTYFYKDARFNGTVRVNEGSLRLGAVTISANGLEINILDGLLSSTAELNYLIGVTSNVQTQLNLKAPIANPQFTGTARLATDTLATRAYARASGASGEIAVIQAQLYDTIPITEIGFTKDDTTTILATKHDLTNIEAGGGGGSVAGGFEYVKGITGVTDGFPGAGDSTFTHAGFIGKYVIPVRDGLIQQQHNDNTETEGFHFNSVTGTATFRPVFSDNEKLDIYASNTLFFTPLVVEGYESSLQTGLIGYWQFDEVGGSTFYGELGNNGTSTATLGAAGRMGLAQRFDGLGDYSRVPYASSLSVTGLDDLTISCWFRLDSIDIANGQNLVVLKTTDANYWSVMVRVDAENAIVFYAKNSTGTLFESETAINAVVAGTWYNVICTVNGTGNPLEIYLDGVSSAVSPDTFTGTLLPYNDHIYFGSGSASSISYERGYLDEVAIWTRALTSGERTTVVGGTTYPF